MSALSRGMVGVGVLFFFLPGTLLLSLHLRDAIFTALRSSEHS